MRVDFEKMLINRQGIGPPEQEFMVSQVFFRLSMDGKPIRNTHTDVKQTVGSDAAAGLLEVGPPVGYDGPFNREEFRKAVQTYYRTLIGPRGKVLQIAGPVTGLSLVNMTFPWKASVEFELRG